MCHAWSTATNGDYRYAPILTDAEPLQTHTATQADPEVIDHALDRFIENRRFLLSALPGSIPGFADTVHHFSDW